MLVRRSARSLAPALQQLLEECDVQVNGSRPFDLQLKDPRALDRVLRHGSLGLGESYMDGQWECERIDELVDRVLRSATHDRFTHGRAYRWLMWAARVWNLQSRSRAGMVGARHYDVGNDLYEQMLDSSMNYSCGYWQYAATLEQAQRDKMELICRKLELTPGMRVLDIGCGWGGFARYAAEHHGAQVLGVTISREQHAWAQAHTHGAHIEIRCQDYRDVGGQFDRIVSVGMFEHVGAKNYAQFFRKCEDLLRNEGLMLLHTIGSNTSAFAADPWLHRYIFPNGSLPSMAHISRHQERYMVLEDVHSFGPYYDRTLLAWHRRVTDAWPALGGRYDERFRRMWNYYLLACAGAFRARHVQLWQFVWSKGRRSATYQRPSLDRDATTSQTVEAARKVRVA